MGAINQFLDTARGFIDAHSAILGLVILALLFVEFARERYPVAVVSVFGACAFAALGLLDEKSLFSVFSNSAPLTIGAMFVLSGALIRTGTINRAADFVMRRAEKHPRLAIAEVFGGALFASAFLNNTPVVVVLIPIVFKLAEVTGMPVKKLMMPLSIVAVLGGTITLIGTSTNLVVAGIAQQAGMTPFGIFEITPYGLAAAAAGTVTLLALARLLPSDPPSIAATPEGGPALDYLTELVIGPEHERIGDRVGDLGIFGRSTVLLGIKRGGAIERGALDDWVLQAGDRLLVKADGTAIMTLREQGKFEMGIATMAGATARSGSVVEAMIAPEHPSIGDRLADIPFLQTLRVRVIGLTRNRHLPGPDLANARIRGADRLLIAAEDETMRALRDNPTLMGVDISRERAFRRNKAWIAIAALVAVVGLSALDLVSIGVAAVLAVGVILAARCIDGEEAWNAIDGNVLILIFAMLAVGVGLERAGSVALMVQWLTPLLEAAPRWSLVFLVYFFALVLSELLSNNAVAALLTPITIALAQELGVDARPLVIALMIGASACFATPIGYQTNALVYAAADYRFVDFVRIGVPLNIVVGLAACAAISFY